MGYALYDAAHRDGVGWFVGLLVWPFIPLTAAVLMFSGMRAYTTLWVSAGWRCLARRNLWAAHPGANGDECVTTLVAKATR